MAMFRRPRNIDNNFGKGNIIYNTIITKNTAGKSSLGWSPFKNTEYNEIIKVMSSQIANDKSFGARWNSLCIRTSGNRMPETMSPTHMTRNVGSGLPSVAT